MLWLHTICVAFVGHQNHLRKNHWYCRWKACDQHGIFKIRKSSMMLNIQGKLSSSLLVFPYQKRTSIYSTSQNSSEIQWPNSRRSNRFQGRNMSKPNQASIKALEPMLGGVFWSEAKCASISMLLLKTHKPRSIFGAWKIGNPLMLTWQNPAKRNCKSKCDVKQICLDLEEFHGEHHGVHTNRKR